MDVWVVEKLIELISSLCDASGAVVILLSPQSSMDHPISFAF